ncbi:hypothetical protein F5Y17DRAFT_428115 [Xylariaceae sp. FL0594]|nr:hypothetical protein F5Y17DRAFT_428115 [Xylariaceae sp. FL0594]
MPLVLLRIMMHVHLTTCPPTCIFLLCTASPAMPWKLDLNLLVGHLAGKSNSLTSQSFDWKPRLIRSWESLAFSVFPSAAGNLVPML